MYLKKIGIENIRSIEHLMWEVSKDDAAGWHVIIGDNGAGKSTVLRAIALALVGPREAPALRQDWNDWLKRGTNKGEIWLAVDWEPKFDRFSGKGNKPSPTKQNVNLTLAIMRADPATVVLHVPDVIPAADRHVWGPGAGWFSASYGPFRRFSGGDKDQEKLFYSNPKLARHLSVFGESIALSECLVWLKNLHYKFLEGDPEGDLLEPVKKFVNQSDFLPHDTRLESVSSKGVRFVDGNRCEVDVESLSDGYRSILSMTFELIRQLAATYGADAIFAKDDPTKIVVPGVVLVDEIDAHLHPTWQRRIGQWFCDHFPMIQFIVTTHSPLVCQSAYKGSIFRLPRPGSEEKPAMVTGLERDRLLYGNVLDAYGTGAFGDVAAQSDKALEMLERLAMLNQKELTEGLTRAERQEQRKLRAILPTAASAMPEDDE
ncbi:MAG: AAA family ATPase [Polyangiaceae bacterium]|nr:AAA family ATPase [Polyangiaceae bacterium]